MIDDRRSVAVNSWLCVVLGYRVHIHTIDVALGYVDEAPPNQTIAFAAIHKSNSGCADVAPIVGDGEADGLPRQNII